MKPIIALPDEGIIGRGWAIFECHGSSNGFYQLQRYDEQELFPDDKAAWKHVWKQAVAGDDLCLKALSFLKTANPQEFGLIRRHAARCQLLELNVPLYEPPPPRALSGRRKIKL